jgi:transposase, IS30 family
MISNITIEERIKIKALHDQGHGVSSIAKYLKRHKTSIYRELSKRNESGVYDYQHAQKVTSANMARQGHQKPTEETITQIEIKIINDQWSPEQISGWLKLNHGIHISHTWIYQYVEKDRIVGGELSNHMRRGKYSFEPREYKGKIKNRITIDERPEIINERKRLGDFEIDLIVGPKNKGAILTVVDRLSRQCIIEKLSCKSSKEIKNVLLNAFNNYDGQKHSITSDNGSEFTLHEEISKDLKLDYYFAHPYASYERGSIENLNGLIRQYIPKGKAFDDIDQSFVKQIEEKLNSRPRKVLKFLTPREFYENMCLNMN